MELVVFYYVVSIIGAIAATVVTGRQLIRALRKKWIDEGAQITAISQNAAALKDFGTVMKQLSDKFDQFGEKLIDHETRIHWIEITLPEDKRPPSWRGTRF